MKYAILLGDGMADWPLPDYGNRTPLEIANTPNMDRVAALGITGLFGPIPDGLPPGSDVGNLSCFGYDPRVGFTGRAPIEAARQGIVLGEDEVAFRCNLVAIGDGQGSQSGDWRSDGVMKDFTAGHISTEDARPIIALLNETLGKEFPVEFHTGVSYRHIAVVRASEAASLDALVRMKCEPPHNITDKAVAPWLPTGAGEELIRAMMARSREVIGEYFISQISNLKSREGEEGRGESSEEAHVKPTQIWLWGQGRKPVLESYRDKFGLSGGVISAVDLVRGIGVLAGLEVIEVPGATGWIDTDYEGKLSAALKCLEDHDFVYVHLEAPDETAHQGRADLKIQAIEDFDARIVGPMLKYQEKHPDLRIFVAPDHFTTIETKTHAPGLVPFAMCGMGIAKGGCGKYSEKDAAGTGVRTELGFALIEEFIKKDRITG